VADSLDEATGGVPGGVAWEGTARGAFGHAPAQLSEVELHM
jgi:hypothetical protein